MREQVELYESSGGTKGTTLRDTGLPVIVLTTRGARSGKIRKTPLMRVEHDGAYAVVASQGGAPRHPVWYFNVRSEPHVELQDGPVRRDMRAREVTGPEKDAWWERAVAAFPPYAEYQEKTSRESPCSCWSPSTGAEFRPGTGGFWKNPIPSGVNGVPGGHSCVRPPPRSPRRGGAFVCLAGPAVRDVQEDLVGGREGPGQGPLDAYGDLFHPLAVQARGQVDPGGHQRGVEAHLHREQRLHAVDLRLCPEQRPDPRALLRVGGLADELVAGVAAEPVGDVHQQDADRQ